MTDTAAREKFNICLLEWPGPVPYFEAYREFSETVHYGLQRLGYESTFSVGQVNPDRRNIIFGFQVLSPAALDTLPDGTILYNLEQIYGGKPLKPAYYQLTSKFTVWEYSTRNYGVLQSLGTQNLELVPIGYVPEMTRIKPADSLDIDVLFYGLLNDRRERVLRTLGSRGLKVKILTSIYGKERDRYIARAKIVLNMHLYEAQIFEAVRVSYLLANSKAVVSEFNNESDMDEGYRDAVILSPYENLVDACIELLADDSARQAQEARGFAIMSTRDETVYLGEALAPATVPTHPATGHRRE